MTTDHMILALVERHGFKLPEGLHVRPGVGFEVRGYDPSGRFTGKVIMVSDQTANDLCAMGFARQAHSRSNAIINQDPPRVTDMLALGDSAAAIKALYDAMEAK